MTAPLILGIILAAVILVIIATVKSLIIICPPNRVAVISGRSRQLSDGRTVGYRSIRGGRTLRVPLLEKVSWMELNTIPIEVGVQNAYSKGAIPLHVQGIANVKVSSIEGLLQNSVERFLEVPQYEIAGIAKETLEANLRGVLATLTPEEVNEDRLKFAQTLMDEADDDMKTLGLELDVLKIQNVTDEVGYLDSVGRRQTAEVLKEARVAEAQRKAEAEESEAASRQRAEIATAQADLKIVEEQNNLRVRQAELEALAGAAEAEAKVAGEKARVVAEQSLETERVELETRRLEADIVAPARADLEAKELAAKADAAKIIEEGNAQVQVFHQLVEQYQAAGPDAQRIFVLRMLPELIDKIVSTVGSVDIDKVSIIDSGGQGTGVPGFMGQLPGAVISLTEQLENATGVDLLKALRPDPEPAASASTSGTDVGQSVEPADA
ncbi:MAG: flotillin family protein [Acidimicrobiales bacterium]